jgi:hypothetical protein
VERGKISLKVKYSLLTVILPDEETASYWNYWMWKRWKMNCHQIK